ncbi:hypothetical protein CO671_25865 [Rhizobium sp. M10]|nr:hypothetical protein CO671_25865 [Rhizobium sp. M10]
MIAYGAKLKFGNLGLLTICTAYRSPFPLRRNEAPNGTEVFEHEGLRYSRPSRTDRGNVL